MFMHTSPHLQSSSKLKATFGKMENVLAGEQSAPRCKQKALALEFPSPQKCLHSEMLVLHMLDCVGREVFLMKVGPCNFNTIVLRSFARIWIVMRTGILKRGDAACFLLRWTQQSQQKAAPVLSCCPCICHDKLTSPLWLSLNVGFISVCIAFMCWSC